MKFFMMIMIAATVSTTSAWSATGKKWISGKIKSFDEKSVVIEQNGKLLEFDINRVKDKKKLKVGSEVEIALN